jgi:hypothetical protein
LTGYELPHQFVNNLVVKVVISLTQL